MFGECCPECGHLLSKNRSVCPYCGWDEDDDKYNYSLNIENDLSCLDPNEFSIDQPPGL